MRSRPDPFFFALRPPDLEADAIINKGLCHYFAVVVGDHFSELIHFLPFDDKL